MMYVILPEFVTYPQHLHALPSISMLSFLSAYGPITQHFRPRRHLLSAAAYRQEMRKRFASWAEVTGTERAA